MPVERINYTDPLRTGTDKINDAIDAVNTFQTQIDEIVVEGDSSVEAAQARVTPDGTVYASLRARLDAEYEEVTKELAEKASSIELQSIASGAPKGTYATLAELQAAFPSGNNNIYVVLADGNWYYWGGSAWTSGGIYQASTSNEFPATNLVSNGNFSNGTTGWTPQNSTLSAAANTLSIVGNGGSPFVTGLTPIGNKIVGHKYYYRVRARVTNAVSTNLGITGDAVIKFQANPVQNQWYDIKAVHTATTTYSSLLLQHRYADAATANGKVAEIQYALVLNLTQIFGAGNEPTETEMDEILAKFPNNWFGGTVGTLKTNKTLDAELRALKVSASAKNNYLMALILSGQIDIVLNGASSSISVSAPVQIGTQNGGKQIDVSSLTFTDSAFAQYFFIDTEASNTNRFVVTTAPTNFKANERYALLGVYFQGKFTGISAERITINGESAATVGAVSLTGKRIVFPDVLHLLKGFDYKIQNTNILYPFSFKDIHRVNFEVPLLTGVESGKKQLTLNIADEVSLDTMISAVSDDNKLNLQKDIKIISKDLSDVVIPSTALNYLCIGDSLTNDDLPASIKWWLDNWGIPNNSVGTVNNTFDYGYPQTFLPTGIKGEGRGGFWITDFTGGLYFQDGSPVVRNDYGLDFYNPTTQTFDIDRYYAQHPEQAVYDFATIWLGTNDLIQNGGQHPLDTPENPVVYPTIEQVYTYYPQKLQIMVDELKSKNPNVKIALIAPPLRGRLTDYNQKAGRMAELVNHHFKNQANVSVLPLYANIGIDASPGNSHLTRTPYSSENNTFILNDYNTNVHFGGNTQMSNAFWIASWIASNM